MKIEAIREKLVEAVSRAEKVAQRNPTLPVLSGLSLEALGAMLTIRATNLDLGISIHIPVKVEKEGHVVVPAQVFSALLNSLSKEKSISLSAEGQVLSVNTPSTHSSVKTLAGEEFPIIPEIGGGSNFSIPAKDLVTGLKAVLYAAAVGSIKPELSSVCLIHEAEALVFVATDSFRLAEKRVKVKKIPNFTQILIPQKNASEIVRIFDGVDDDIAITIEENQIAFRAGSIYLTSRTIDGQFPDYKQIIPTESVSRAVVLKQDLLSSLKTSLIFSDSFNQLKLSVSPEHKKFEVESKNQDIGENKDTVPAALEGKDISVSVNHRYLTDGFSSTPADSLSLAFAGEGRPIVVEGVGDKSFRYLLMPMNR
ncbi:DNA polymerase III subunit beta [Candidatus Parcubacteria bacterium]|nr:DNA polymerase III subunit beta [Candidatus Parcubacteria bacterium]